MVNQPTHFVSNCWSVSTSPSLIRFRSTSELFSRPCSAHMSGNSSLLPKFASVSFLGLPRFLFTVILSELFPRPLHTSGNSALLSKLASVCFLGLPRFPFTAVLFPRLCSAVTIGNSTFGCFDIVCDQGRPLTSTLFERMMTTENTSWTILNTAVCHRPQRVRMRDRSLWKHFVAIERQTLSSRNQSVRRRNT